MQSWRIGFSDAKLPDEATIDRRLRLTNPNHIILNCLPKVRHKI
ncbi:hypothetical protein [Streptococcus equi]